MARTPSKTAISTPAIAPLRVSDELPPAVRALQQLYVAAAALDDAGGTSPVGDDLLHIVRRLFVTQVLDQRPTVAIVGLQGAGKSALTAALYPELIGTLPSNVGRGETLPVRVVEQRGCRTPEAWAYVARATAGGATDRVRIAGAPEGAPAPEDKYESLPPAAAAAIGARAGKPEPGDLLLELVVEPRWFGGGDTCLLLLPGFERREDAWDAVARHAAATATACVLCVEPARMADEASRGVIKEVLEGFGPGRTVVALTKADTDRERNEGHKSTFIRDFGVPSWASERVVCTGAPAAGEGVGIKDLAAQLARVVPTAHGARDRGLLLLEGLVQRELGESLVRMRDARRAVRAQAVGSTIEIEEKLRPFDEAAAKVRKQYGDKLRKSLDARVEHARREVEKGIIDEDVLDKVWTAVFGTSLKDHVDFRCQVEKAWSPAAARADQALVIGEVVAAHLRIELADASSRAAYKGEDVGAEGNGLLEAESTALAHFLGEEALPREVDLAATFRALPAVALEYARLAHVAGDIFRGDAGPADGRLGEITQEFEGAAKVQKALFALIGGFLVLDGAKDGKIDSLPNLARALGFGVAAASAAGAGGAAAAGASTAAGAAPAAAGAVVSGPVLAAAGGILAAVGVVIAVRHLNKGDVERAGNAHRVFVGVADATLAECLTQYDEAMSQVKAVLVRRLERMHHVDDGVRRLWHADLAIAAAGESRLRLLEAIRAERATQ